MTPSRPVGGIVTSPIGPRPSPFSRSLACRANLLDGPPATYEHTALLQKPTLDLVRQRWPQLEDLASDGTLIAIPRASDYVERRADGYQEPELVLLVGTAHVSQRSAADVERVIKVVRPENVVVEVCASRVALLYDEGDEEDAKTTTTMLEDNERGRGREAEATRRTPPDIRGGAMVLSGSGFIDSISRTVKLGGKSALVLRLLLGSLSERLSSILGVRTGIEFRAARRAAEDCGAQIVLGDRPIEVTLRRAWDALSWSQRTSIVRDLLSGLDSFSLKRRNLSGENRCHVGRRGTSSMEALDDGLREWPDSSPEHAYLALERFRNDDFVSAMLKSLTERYPDATRALVHERDLYLAWSLKRSKAVNGTRVVVGIVGRGHVRGVCYALLNDDGSLRFRDLAGRRGSRTPVSETKTSNSDWTLAWDSWMIRLALETVVFSGLWWLWTHGFGT